MGHMGLSLMGLNTYSNKIHVWTDIQDKAFSALKQAPTTALVLALPDFSRPFAVETDASGTRIGAVLMQGGHPLSFLSKALGPRSQGLSTYEKEYMVILLALEHWHSYLQHAEFQITTDHRSLVQLTEQRLHTPWQQKVFTKLIGLQYQIVYRKGSDNGAANADSLTLSSCTFGCRVSLSGPVAGGSGGFILSRCSSAGIACQAGRFPGFSTQLHSS
jgi:hypothetical protein